MATVNELALQQALVALIGAIRTKRLDDRSVIEHAVALLMGNSIYCCVDQPHLLPAMDALYEAKVTVLSLERLDLAV